MKDEKAYRPFQLLALTVPAAEAAAGKNWLPTLILALASVLVCTWISALADPNLQWLNDLRSIAAVLLLSGLLNWTHDCWPGRGAAYAVPGVLVLLAVYAVWRGSAVRAASVLRYGVYLIFLLLAISGLLQLRWSQLRPRAELPSMALAAALLLPLLGRKGKTWHVFPNGLIAAAAAFITAGTASLYAYSRGLSLAGVTEHLESLAACALTAGWFASICYVLDSVKEKEEKDNRIPFLGVLAYGIYALGVRFRPEIFVILELTLWAVIPTLWSMREKLRNGVK
mgnify:FL=1